MLPAFLVLSLTPLETESQPQPTHEGTLVNADLSVVPEIAQLAAPLPAPRPAVTLPRTAGRVAGDLADLAAAPGRWWNLVRFDPSGPVLVPLPDAPGVWLLTLPPGASVACDCAQATALAGKAAEGRPLRPGHVLVHGSGQHRLQAAGHGYSVTLHAQAT